MKKVLNKMQKKESPIKVYFIVVTILFLFSCNHKSKEAVFVETDENGIKMEIDSIGVSELIVFPMRIKLTNNQGNKILLSFKVDSLKSSKYIENMFLVSETDTFNLWIDDRYLIFNERSITSFNCYGIFTKEEGRLLNFNDFDDFNKLRLVYKKENTWKSALGKRMEDYSSDTLIVPNIIIGTALGTKVVKFGPDSYNRYERPIE